MNEKTITGLINNTALLITLGLIYDSLMLNRYWGRLHLKIIGGFLFGLIGIAVMKTPLEFMPGIIFDTRSILISVGGYFLGPIPAAIAMIMTSALRIYHGGTGMWTGVAVIITSGSIGLTWRYLRRNRSDIISMPELYLLGIVVHAAMLLLMLSLPWPIAKKVLSDIGVPVMIIYPAGTVLLGKFLTITMMRKQAEDIIIEKNEELQAANEELQSAMEELETTNEELTTTQIELEQNEKQYRTLFTEMHDGYALKEIIYDNSGSPIDYRFIDINPAFEKLTGLTRDIIGKTVLEIYPDIEQIWINISEEVALTGKSKQFENYMKKLDKWLEVTAFRPTENQLASILRDITERKKADERIKLSLREKETLLQEVHHRVKNNMQVITSLLNLQACKIKDKKAREPFITCENRIRSMALVHDKLYNSKDMTSINFNDYINNLVNEIFSSSIRSRNNIKSSINTNNISLTVEKAIPTGLIITELVSNALKHAFKEEKDGMIAIDFVKSKAGNYILTVQDNGIGLPDDFDTRKEESLGYQLVNALTTQLNGKIEIFRENGTKITIIFPSPD